MNSYPPPNRVSIDLSALVHNLRQVQKEVGKGVRVMGIVKSDAYGHGMVPVARALLKNGVDCLGVAFCHEGLGLREVGIRVPVFLLCGVCSRLEAEQAVAAELTPVVYDHAMLEILDQESARRGRQSSIHVKVDTGMNRLGIGIDDIGEWFGRVQRAKHLRLQGLMSHFSTAGEEDATFSEGQLAQFKRAVEAGRSVGFALPLNSIANSAGILKYPHAHMEMVRPGILLYGGLALPKGERFGGLKPVMKLRGQVLQVRVLPGAAPVSYDRTYMTSGPTTVAVVSVGYADGLPRALSNLGAVLIHGRRAPILGSVCMNLTVCDVTLLHDVRPGDEAVFLGSQGDRVITGDDMAAWAGTISYEVFCSIGRRNDKEYTV